MARWHVVAVTAAVVVVVGGGMAVLGTRPRQMTSSSSVARSSANLPVVKQGRQLALGVFESELPQRTGFRSVADDKHIKPGTTWFSIVWDSIETGNRSAVLIDSKGAVWLTARSMTAHTEMRRLVGQIDIADFNARAEMRASALRSKEEECQHHCRDCGHVSFFVADTAGQPVRIALGGTQCRQRAGPAVESLTRWMLAVERVALSRAGPWPPPLTNGDAGRD